MTIITAPFHALRTRKPSPPQPIPGRILAVIDHDDQLHDLWTLTFPDGRQVPLRNWRATTTILPSPEPWDHQEWTPHPCTVAVTAVTATGRRHKWDDVTLTTEQRDTHHTRYTIKAQP